MTVRRTMRTKRAIRQELGRVRRLLNRREILDYERREQYGALQALEWVLDAEHAARPSSLADSVKKERR